MSFLDNLPKYSGPSFKYPNRGAYEVEISKIIRKHITGNDSDEIIGIFSIDGLSPSQQEKFESALGFDYFLYQQHRFLHSNSYDNSILLIFEDFRPIAFVRDMVLAKVLETSYKYLKLPPTGRSLA